MPQSDYTGIVADRGESSREADQPPSGDDKTDSEIEADLEVDLDSGMVGSIDSCTGRGEENQECTEYQGKHRFHLSLLP